MNSRSIAIILYLILLPVCLAQVPRPAVRVRLNKGIFDQASSIVAALVEYEVPRVRMPSMQQCFTEGCVTVHSFQMTSFRQPTFVAFHPSPPNQFQINVNDLDFSVSGHLSGSIQILIQIPVTGNVYVTGRGISVTAQLDLQKTVNDEPYLRFLSCRITGGHVETRLADMGLFTDTINQRYHHHMSAQSRHHLEEAICQNMNRITQIHFSRRIARLPDKISAMDLLSMVVSPPSQLTAPASANRGKRAADKNDDYYDEIDKTSPTTFKPPTNPLAGRNVPQIHFTARDLNNFFNLNRLSHLMIDLSLLDASSTNDDFSVGMAGIVTSSKSPGTSPYTAPFPFRLPVNSHRRMVEVIISEYTLNTMLYHAHRTNSLLFHVDSKTPGVGNLLKTTCSMDEVCLSDEIAEVGRRFPGRHLELIIRTTQPPQIQFSQDMATVTMEGRVLFFLEGTRQKVGVIPFSATVNVQMKTVGNMIQGAVSISRLKFLPGIDFFGMSSEDLDGFRVSTKTALETMANSALGPGVPIATSEMKLPMKLSAPHISLQPGVMLVQANVDLFHNFYPREE